MSETDFAGAPATPAVQVAPWGRRFGAWLLDTILLGIVPTFITVGRMLQEMKSAGLLDEALVPGDQAQVEAEINEIVSGMMGEIFLLGFVFAILSYVYYVLMHGTLGRTLGKMAFGLKVIKDDGTPCDFAAAAKRGVVHPLATAVPTAGSLILLLNGLWPLWDEKHQSLGDKVGGTYVIRNRPAPEVLRATAA